MQPVGIKAKGLACIISPSLIGSQPSTGEPEFQQAVAMLKDAESVRVPGAILACTETVSSKRDITAAVAGYPQWRDHLTADIAETHGHAAAIIMAYESLGDDFLTVISGTFCLALYDRKNELCLAATDRLGRMPLYYSQQNGTTTIASNLGMVSHLSGGAGKIHSQAIYNYVYFHMVPSPESIYKAINSLPAAHYLKVKCGQLTTKCYWQPNFHQISIKSQKELALNLRQVLKRSVENAVGDERNVAAFLSGGLDSSTVAGYLSEISGGETHAYSIGFSAEGYDEMAYARHTAKHFGITLNEYYVTPEDIVDALPEVAASFDEPFGNSSALPAWFCAKCAAKNGVNRLLAGDGGDELFAGNERYAKQELFERYLRSPAFLRNYLLEPLVKFLPGRAPLATKAKSFIQQANTSLPDRLQAYNFLHRHLATEVFSSEFLSDVDTQEPLELLRDVYKRPGDTSPLNRMLYLDWQFTLADNDLRKVSQMCAKAGVDVTYPMLDDDLVEFSTKIEDNIKLKGSNLRYFYKESLRGWLPELTLTKEKHGFGLPFGVWLQEYTPLKEMAYGSLLSLQQRGLFNPDFIDNAIELHRSGHASYYGELVWILMVLEFWLDSRKIGA